MATVNEFLEENQVSNLEMLLPSVSQAECQGRIEEYVRLALGCPHPPRKVPERRVETRHPYPYPVYLTPIDRMGHPIAGESLVVIGKHLSDHGVDFYHRLAVPHREMICSLPVGERRWVSFVLELSWCRFSSHGWYENGGKFLRTAPTPEQLQR